MAGRSLALALGLAMLAWPAQALPSADTHEPRIAQERYVAGTGDVACLVIGLGCVLFYVEGDEQQVTLTIDDDVVNAVGANVCSPDCLGINLNFCNEITVEGLRPGDAVRVFIFEANGTQGCALQPPGAGVTGTVTAAFT